MKSCRAHTKERVPCTKRALPGSRYCFLHQDPATWVVATALGILITVTQTWYQDASPLLDVRCHPTGDEDPSRLECLIANRGRAEARDVIVGFNHSLPLDTQIAADPDLGITLSASRSPPHPHLQPTSAITRLAFSVTIPRVAPRSHVSFQVFTGHPDNVRAAQQLIRIHAVQREILTDLTSSLRARFPDATKDWNLEALLASHAFEGNFFKPSRYSYEQGRYPVLLLPEEQESAKARDQEIYAQFKPRLIEIWQGRPSFAAPVVRIQTHDGDSTYAIHPADVETCVVFVVERGALSATGKVTLAPPVPDRYDKDVCA